METVPLEKPCKVSTERGFSILYKNRYLYSKYNPQKAILQTIASLEIREGTLILCFSPGLWYGFTELIAKLPENCLLVACEADPALHNFSKEELSGCQNLSNSRLIFLSHEEALQFPQNLAQDIEKKFPQIKKEFVKRVIRLDFSAGVQFNQEFYTKIFSLCQTVTAQFWKNRLTLVKFGRLYSSNLIQNIARSQTSKSIRFEKLKKSISKPVLVLGTGESLERTVNLLADKNLRKKCYILAADATLPVLTANGIFPDAVAGVESQLAIEKSYIGTASHTEKPFLFFADTTSRFHVADIAPGKVCYFTSEYDTNNFFCRLKNLGILPRVFPPMGSVGLSAVYIALNLRTNENIPVFVSGMDFSFSAGKTHSNGSASHKAQLTASSRLSPPGNYAAAFDPSNSALIGKNNIKIITTPVLLNYAQNFPLWFENCRNLFDIGQRGIKLNLPLLSENEFVQKLSTFSLTTPELSETHEYQSLKTQTFKFIEEELFNLNELKDILSGNTKKLSQENDFNQKQKILEILKDRNYLYLHFPDGFRANLEISFLKRVRSELNFFIKTFSLAKKILES